MWQPNQFAAARLVIVLGLGAAAWAQQGVESGAKEPGLEDVEAALAASRSAIGAGRYEDGLRFAEEAVSAARGFGDAQLTADSLGQKGIANLLLARYPEAAQTLEESLALGDGADTDQRLNDLTNLGVAYHYMGSYTEAVQRYETTLELARAHAGEPNVRRREQIAAVNLATLYQRLGRQQRALNLYREQASGESALLPSEQARMLSNMGALYRRLGDPVKALEAYSGARALYRQERNPRGELNTELNAAVARAFGLGDLDAEEELRQVVTTAERQGDRNQAAKARLYLAELALRREPSKARTLYEQVLDQAKTYGMAEEQWRAEYGLSRAAEGRQSSEAIGYLEQAVDTIESVRARIAAPSLSAEYMADRDSVYDDLIALRLAECCESNAAPDSQQLSTLLGLIGRQQARSFDDRLNARLSRSEQAGDSDVLRRLRLLREEIFKAAADSGSKVAELETEFESLESQLFRYLPGRNSFDLEHIRQRLGENEAAWVLWLGDHAGCVIWLTRESATLSVLPSSQSVVEQAGLLRKALTTLGASGWMQPAKNLGAALFSVPHSLNGTAHLRLVPDATIAGIPLEVLWDVDSHGQSKQLLEEFTTSYHPSLAELAEPPAMVASANSGLTLVVANPASDVAIPLRFAVQEGRFASAAIHGEDVILEGAAAARSAVIDAIAAKPEVVHFAAHAELNSVEPEFSSLLLSGQDSILLGDVYTWDLSNARLVTLSACETADGRNTPGEGVAALDRAFLAAGASNVVATLWRVDDQATSYFMQRFYHRLGVGMSPSRAMQETKMDFRDSGGPYSHPFYWAAFTLSGEAVTPVIRPIPWQQVLLFSALALGILAMAAGRRMTTAASPR